MSPVVRAHVGGLCIIAQVGDPSAFADGKGRVILSAGNVIGTLLVFVGVPRGIPTDINISLQQ